WTAAQHVIVHNHIALVHPGLTVEMKALETYDIEVPKGTTLKEILEGYRSKCIHCNRHPGIVRRDQHLTNIASQPRQILLADYLYINTTGYILVLMDECTRKALLKYSPT